MSDAHKALGQIMGGADPHSIGLLNLLRDIYPAFERKLFHNNEFMRQLVISGYNPMDILDYPICGRCETLAPYNGYGMKDGKLHDKCTCMSCGQSTIAPVTLREWIVDELKGKAPPDIAEVAEFVVDVTAARMMKIAYSNYARVLNGKNAQDDKKIYFANGTEKSV